MHICYSLWRFSLCMLLYTPNIFDFNCAYVDFYAGHGCKEKNAMSSADVHRDAFCYDTSSLY